MNWLRQELISFRRAAMGLDNRMDYLFDVLKSLGFVVRRSQISHDYNAPPCLSLECYIGQEPEVDNTGALSVNNDVGYYESFSNNGWQAVPSSATTMTKKKMKLPISGAPLPSQVKLIVTDGILYLQQGEQLQAAEIRQINGRGGEDTSVVYIKPISINEDVNGFHIESIAANPLEPNLMNYLLYKDEKLLGTFDNLEEAELVAGAPLFLDNLKAVLGKSRLEPGALDVLDKKTK